MSQVLMKMIKIHEGPSTRQLENLTLEELEYFPDNFLINIKSIRMSHKIFQPIPRRIFKSTL